MYHSTDCHCCFLLLMTLNICELVCGIRTGERAMRRCRPKFAEELPRWGYDIFSRPRNMLTTTPKCSSLELYIVIWKFPYVRQSDIWRVGEHRIGGVSLARWPNAPRPWYWFKISPPAASVISTTPSSYFAISNLQVASFFSRQCSTPVAISSSWMSLF